MKMIANKSILNRLPVFYLLLIFISIFTTDCTVQFVARYDEAVKNDIIHISSEVDKFYSRLLETDVNERTYNRFREEYLEIESDIRTLLTKNQIRPLNDESTKQTENALKLWLDDKDTHKKNNTVSDFIINSHRSQFQRLFVAMAKGEQAKQ